MVGRSTTALHLSANTIVPLVQHGVIRFRGACRPPEGSFVSIVISSCLVFQSRFNYYTAKRWMDSSIFAAAQKVPPCTTGAHTICPFVCALSLVCVCQISKLTGLLYFNMAGNRLTRLPPEVGKLSALRRLGLKGNALVRLPPSLGNLSHLVELYLTGNILEALPNEVRFFSCWFYVVYGVVSRWRFCVVYAAFVTWGGGEGGHVVKGKGEFFCVFLCTWKALPSEGRGIGIAEDAVVHVLSGNSLGMPRCRLGLSRSMP